MSCWSRWGISSGRSTHTPALLLVPGAHLRRCRLPAAAPAPAGALGLIALALAPLALLLAFYAHQLGLGPADALWTAVRLLAGGHIAISRALWSSPWMRRGRGYACLRAAWPGPEPRMGDRARITIRGPRSYAGPGSLGGTESALRR